MLGRTLLAVDSYISVQKEPPIQKYLVSACYVLGTFLGVVDRAVNEKNNPLLS